MIVPLLALLSSLLHADLPDLDAIYARKLAHADSQAEIDQLESTVIHLKTLRLACELQLRRHEVPVSCYANRRQEQRWASLRETPRTDDLDVYCRKATRGLRLPSLSAPLGDLSPDCREHIETARRVRAYREADAR